MKLIKPKAELLEQSEGLEGVYKQIELCSRTCYKSEDKITEDSAKPFVDRMIKSHHLAMLEHATIYLKKEESIEDYNYMTLQQSPYAVNICWCDYSYVTTNLRTIIELLPTTWHEFLNTHMCEPTEFHEKRYTFRLTTSIGVTRELNRHRTSSVAEMSTRYCNFSKDKFGNTITFMTPSWVNYDSIDYDIFLCSLHKAEQSYFKLLEEGWQPQQAREVLPLCTASEIIHTAFASDWRHFFDLRYFEKTGKVHPNMKELTELMKEECEKKGIWEDIMAQPSKFNDNN